MTKYKVMVQVTDEYFVEAQNEEDARRIVAYHYSDDNLDTLERGDTEVFIFSGDGDDVEKAEEVSHG